jgi:hypothetical protein
MLAPDGQVVWLRGTSNADADSGQRNQVMGVFAELAGINSHHRNWPWLMIAFDRSWKLENRCMVWDLKAARNTSIGDLQTTLGIPSGSYTWDLENPRRAIHPQDRACVFKSAAQVLQTEKDTRQN